MDVSIIIVNYNTVELTKNCINSVIQYTKDIEYEIIVVDNASTDQSSDILSKIPEITYIKNKRNIGFGRANNIGYKIAKGDFIFLLNSDTLLTNNAIKIFHDRLSKMELDIACIGCILQDANKINTYSYGDFISIPNLIKPFFRRVILHKNNGSEMKKHPYFFVDVVLGADMFIRREAIKILGNSIFDPNYFMYHEENDFQKLLSKNGYKCAIIDGPKIIHYGGASDIFKKSFSYNVQSQYYYVKKWYGKYYFLCFKIIFIFIQIIKILLSNKKISLKANKIKVLFES